MQCPCSSRWTIIKCLVEDLVLQNAATSFPFLPLFLLHEWSFGDMEFAYDSDELVKRFDHVDAQLGAALDVWDAHGAAEFLGFFERHLLSVKDNDK